MLKGGSIAATATATVAAVECDVRSCLEGVDHATRLPLLERLGAGESEGPAEELGIHALSAYRIGWLMAAV